MDLDREQYINSVNLNIDTDFPYLVLDVINDNSFPRNPGFHVMHWHEDLQFILVLEGTIEVQTLDTSVLIHTGEGLFINKNVVHDGTRGQKVRHLPGGLSELIHRCFCPLGRRGEYIDYILSEKTYQYPLICKVIIHSRQFCSKFKKCRHWFSWHPHWQYCSRRH